MFVQPECLDPHAWLAREPLKTSEQLFAIFRNASAAKPPLQLAPSPVWADTIYAEWDAVMPQDEVEWKAAGSVAVSDGAKL